MPKYEIGLIGNDGKASEIQGPFSSASQAAAVAEHLNAIGACCSGAPMWKWAREGEIVLNDGKLYFLIFSKSGSPNDYAVKGPFESARKARMSDPDPDSFVVTTL